MTTRIGRVRSGPRSHSPTSGSVTTMVFAVCLDQGQHVLVAVEADAQRDDAHVLANVHPVKHQRHQVEII